MLKILHGKPINENNEKIFKTIKEYIKTNNGDKITYIVPTYQMIKDLKHRIFNNTEIKVGEKLNFYLFIGFVNEILKDEAQFQPTVNDIQKEIILKKILKELIEKKEVIYFTKVANYPGFYGDILRLIEEISIENDIQDKNISAKIDNQKLQEIFKIYSKYYEYLNHNDLKDEHMQYKLALKVLNKSKLVSDMELIIVDGFQYLNLYQKKMLNKLSKLGKKVIININYEENKPGIYDRTILFSNLDINQKIKGDETKLNNKLFNHIRENLFTIDHKKINCDNSININGFDEEETEIRYIARKIKKLNLKEDVDLSEIALVVKSQLKYFDLIDELFNEYKIPYYSVNTKTFKQTGLWILINQVFNVIKNNYNRESVLNFLKSNLIDTGLDKQSLDKLEITTWQDGIIHGRDLSYILEDNNEYDIEVKNNIKKIISFFNKINKAKTFKEYSENILNFFEQFNILKALYDIDNEDLLIKELKAYELFKNELKQYGDVIKEKIEFNDYIYWVKKIFKKEMIKSHDNNINSVKILTPSQARSSRFEYVFIPGLIEGEFPSVNYNNWLIKDDERDIFNNLNLNIKSKKESILLDSYLFYKNILNAKSKVFLSYPTPGDGEGGEIVSSFVEEIKNIFIDGTLKQNTVHNYNLNIEDISSAYSLKELKKYFVENIKVDILKSKLPAFATQFKRNLKEYNNTNGLLDNPEIINDLINRYNENYSYSASSLETYIQCPFKFYIEKLLKLEEIKEPEERLDAMQKGDLYHKILFHYFSNEFPGSWDDSLEVYLEGIEKSAAYVFSIYKNKKILPKGIWKITKEEIINNLKLFIKNEYIQEFKTIPTWLEYSFGLPKEYRDSKHNLEMPVSIDLIDEKIKLKGKIDRIDKTKNSDSILIYDYKLSNNRGMYNKDFFEYNEIQIPLYILAVNNIFPDKEVMGGAYYSILHQSKNGIWKDQYVDYAPSTSRAKTVMKQEDWDDYYQGLKERIKELLNSIRNGDFRIDPVECDYCNAESICRYDKTKMGDLDD